jgi:predicted metal-binding membrane protein
MIAMGTELGAGWRLERSSLLARESAPILFVAAAAWLVLILQAPGMGAMAGTMGLGPGAFILLWVVMMAAMMLPALAPVASPYARAASGRRGAVLATFASGYLAVWALVGLLAFAVAASTASLAMAGPVNGRIIAAAVFLIVGLYQLSPFKRACLMLCRSPVQHAADASSTPFAGLVAGTRDGLVCVGSSWALMLVMVPLGFMNLPLMLALAAVVFVERYWSRGQAVARVVGIAALLLGVASIWVPQLAHGLG